ncbi:MAG: CoA transferase, partial [Acidimicrobiales bacterium]|nr:CoA transferase [Acidimicrobiales bacterium]
VGLEARERTGEGQYLETVMLTSMAYAVSEWSVSWPGKEDRVVDSGLHGFGALHRLYPTAENSWLYVEAPRERHWPALCEALGRPDLVDDARFATADARRANDDALADELGAAFAARSADDWAGALRAAGVPAVRADGIDHGAFMLGDEHCRAVGVSVQTIQPGLPDYWRAGFAIDLPGVERRLAPSPLLGEQTEQVLRGIGRTDADIARLEQAGVTTAVGTVLPS